MVDVKKKLLGIVLLMVSPVVVYFALHHIIEVITGIYAFYAVGNATYRILQLWASYRGVQGVSESEPGEPDPS